MFAFLLSLLFITALPADTATTSPARCAELVEAADRSNVRTTPDWQRYLQQIEQALRCYQRQDVTPPTALYVEQMEAYLNLNQNETALQTANSFIDRYRVTADSSQLRRVYYVRGWSSFYQGYLGEAASSFSEALAYARAAPPPDRAHLIANVAFFFQRVKDFDTARQHLQQAKDVLRAVDPTMSRYPEAWGSVLVEEADFLLATTGYSTPDFDQLRRGAIQAEQALGILSDDQHASLKAHAHIIVGEAYGMLGHVDRGRRALQAALQLAQAHDLSSWYHWALLKLGRLHLSTDDLEAADRVFTEALQRAKDVQDQDHIRRLHATFGLLHAKAGDPARAAASFRTANQIVEKQRGTLRTTDWSASFFSSQSWTYRALARNLFLDGRYEEAFQTLARMRARHLQDMQMQMHLTRTMPREQRARYDSLTAALSNVRDRLAQDAQSSEDRTRLARREMQLITARGNLIALDTARATLPLDTLQQQLRKQNQTLITYFIDQGSPIIGRPVQSFAFVVTPDTLHAVRLDGTQTEYRDLLAEVSPLLTDSVRTPTFSTTRFDLDALHRFHEKLYAPLVPYVPADARLIVVPDGPLFQLPMGMFVTEPVGRFAYEEAPYLMQQHPISYELSPTLLAAHRAPPPSTRADLVAFGRSNFEGNTPEQWTGLRPQPAAFTSSKSLPDLPGVETEFDRLQGLFPRGRFLLNERATETAFYDDSNHAQIVHLASHALVQPTDPLQSAFVLTSDTTNDGLLYLHELMGRPLSLPLVVLSACGTAQGTLYDGEGLQGLQYAFRATGAQSTLSTLWPLDDQAATMLTTSFYRHLQDGLPKDVALQRAQREYLQTHDQGLSPFYWAATVFYGSPQPLDLAKPSPFPVLPAAAGVVLLLLGAGFAYARYRRRTRPHG